jgi:uncharacterized protein (TIGR02145 family)
MGCGGNPIQNVAGGNEDLQSAAITKYEAENATLTAPAQKNTNHSGYSGTGFVDGFYNKSGGQVAFGVSANPAGSYKLVLRYSAGNGTSTSMALYVGSTKIKTLTCNGTTNWDTWANLNETVTLAYGNNQIVFKSEASTNKVINLDYITLEPASAPSVYTITASATYAFISPMGSVSVNAGASQTFTISRYGDCMITGVIVDGVNVGAVSTYTFPNVTANHTISVQGVLGSDGLPLEAENATLTSPAKKNTNHRGYSGSGFVDGFYNTTGGAVTFNVSNFMASTYKCVMRYSAGNGTSTNMGLYVGTTKIKTLTFNATSNWDTWADQTESVQLPAGNCQIVYKCESSSNKCVNLDKLMFYLCYRITYGANGATSGTAPVDANLYVPGSAGVVVGNTGKLMKGAKTWAGWAIDASGSQVGFYKPGSIVSMTGNLELFADYQDNIVADNSGNRYECVTIGGQKWLKDNLKATHYNDGTPIPQITDNAAWNGATTGAYCWQGNNKDNYKYGAYYNWNAVSSGKLAPAGYHVATQADWNTLNAYCRSTYGDAACALKETGTTSWTIQNCATNAAQFFARGNGARGSGGFENFMQSALWWTSTPYMSFAAYVWSIPDNATFLSYNTLGLSAGYGVRCVKD